MLSFLNGWDAKEGDFMEEFLLPILAKIYREDFMQTLKQSERDKISMKIVGMNAEGSRSKLWKKHEKYKHLKSVYS